MSLTGKTALVTGAGAGIGRATAIELARRGAHVVLSARDKERARPVLELITGQGGKAEILPMDLASLQSIRDGVGRLRDGHDKLHILVNNAGVWAGARKESADGFEITWAVNVLAPFALTQALLDPLRAARGRVINVASREHQWGRVHWDDLQFTQAYGAKRAYRQSKLVLTALTIELAEREPEITANGVHPGIVGTELFRNFPAFIRFWINLLMLSPENGAKPQIRLASDPELEGVTGRYFHRFKEREPNPLANDKEARKRLWDIVAEHVGGTGA